MRTDTQYVKIVTYSSSVLPDVSTREPGLVPAIEWADDRPVVWKIVTEAKSKEYGRDGGEYLGIERGGGAHNALLRASRFKDLVESCSSPYHRAKARFTLEHYGDGKNIKSDLLQQWDGEYYRGCTVVDYTTDTLHDVVRDFVRWCETGACRFPTVDVRMGGKPIPRDVLKRALRNPDWERAK